MSGMEFFRSQNRNLGTRKFHLIQTGLVNKDIKAENMKDCNHMITLSSTVSIVIDAVGEIFQEDLGYVDVSGMTKNLA